MQRPSSSKTTVLLLLIILMLGAFLRFSQIERRGPSFFDEGIYTLEGTWIHSFSKALATGLGKKIEEIRERQNLYTFEEEAKWFRESLQGEPPVWGRPGFSLLTAICMGLLGPKIYTANLVSAFFGTLSILGVFLLGRALFDEKTALFAAFLLAISGYHLIYSVTGLADGSAMCFAVFAFLFYTKSRGTVESGRGTLWILLAGFVSGISFSVHDRFLYVLLVILVNEGIDLFTQRQQSMRKVKRILLLLASFVFPLFLFELPYYIGMVFLRHFHQPLPFRTYFEELFSHHLFNFMDAFAFSLMDLEQHPEFQEAGSRLWNFLTYPYLFLKFNGVAFCILFLGGLITTIVRRKTEDRLLAVWFVVPFLLFSLGLSVSVRYALVFMPAVTLIAARSLWILGEALTRAKISGEKLRISLTCVLLVLVTAGGFHASRDIRTMVCSYDQPVRFLLEHGKKHVSLQYPVSKAYLGTRNVKPPPYTREMLEQYYREGFRYYLIDYRKFFLKEPFDRSGRGKIIEDIESSIEPDFCTTHPCYRAPCFLFEVNIFFHLTLKLVREAHEMGVDRICIYDLDKYFATR